MEALFETAYAHTGLFPISAIMPKEYCFHVDTIIHVDITCLIAYSY